MQTPRRYTARIEPVLHLSLPVYDLDESRSFYVDVLGCVPGRVRDGWIDVWFYGMQITLHEQPEQVLPAERGGVRHFGVALSEDALDALLQRVGAHRVHWLHERGPGTRARRVSRRRRSSSTRVAT